MTTSAKAATVATEIAGAKLGDLKRRAAEIGTDHDLAMELWATGALSARLLSVLVLDKKRLTQDAIGALAADILELDDVEGAQIADWLLANQLMKDKKLVSIMETWETHPLPAMRRWFWYHQARLRWTGQVPPGNTAALMVSLETDLADAEPFVQWAMNFCAGQIGVHEPAFRSRCIELGENVGLYEDEVVRKNCVPSYLPEFIRIEVAKRAS